MERLLAGAGAKPGLAAAAAAVVTGALLVGAGSRTPAPAPEPVMSAEVVDLREGEAGALPDPEPPALAEVASQASGAAVPDDVPPPTIARSSRSTARGTTGGAPHGVRSVETTGSDAPVPLTNGEDPLAREAALLQDARRALAEGAPARALGILDRHAASFPGGALLDVQRATRVEALCALDRRAEAAALAAEFAADHPDSVTAQVAADGCEAAASR
jgi:hypothetical protein